MMQLYENISSQQRLLIIITVMSATLMQLLDMTIVNVALPYMQGSLNTTSDQVSWTLTSYLVSAAIFMPLTGYFSAKLGRKRYFLSCVIGFVITSILCGSARNLTEIIIFRLFQGAFGAALVPLSQAIMTDIFPPEQRGKAMSIWGGGVLLGPILGPTLGGYLTDIASWRWTFYVNVPIGLFTAALAWQILPDTAVKKREMDWLGLSLFAVSIAMLQYVLDRGNQDNWFSGVSIQLVTVIGSLSFIGFLLHHVEKPANAIFNFGLFKDRNFTVASVLLAVSGLGLFGATVVQPLILENVLHYPVLLTGLSMMPRGISSMVTTLLVGKMLHRVDPRLFIVSGILLTAWGLSFSTQYSTDMSIDWIMMPFILQGLGFGLFFTPLATIAFSTLPAANRVEAAGLYSLCRTLGSSVGISIAMTFWAQHTQIAWNQISSHISVYNPALSSYLGNLSLSPTQPQGAAIVSQVLAAQASLMAYVNDFSFITIVFLCMVPFVFLLRKV